jgi:hypothetical protein
VPNASPYRLVQWTTGNVGKSSVAAIARNPSLELDELLALKPDCVVYNPMWIDVDELVKILSAGVNVVATASFITGRARARRSSRTGRSNRTAGSSRSPGNRR